MAPLSGWRRAVVETLRAAARANADLSEVIKWGHLVYSSGGPVLLIRAEEARVLFGFWRGQLLCELEPRLKPGGKYEMATLDLRESDTIDPAMAQRVVDAAVELNRRLGDPTDIRYPVAFNEQDSRLDWWKGGYAKGAKIEKVAKVTRHLM